MVRLGLNIDHIATIRQARGGQEPDPVTAASIAEMAGADSITVHLREDRRHIQDRDVKILARTLKTPLNLEMAATDEMQKIALGILPHSVCLVPEKRQELTTEGGLDVLKQKDFIKQYIKPLIDKEILVSLFIDPGTEQVQAAFETGAQFVELHTGCYSQVFNTKDEDKAFNELENGAKLAEGLGLKVNAGHGLNYHNVKRILSIPIFYEFNIGHSIISRAVFTGLERAVRDMRSILG